MSDSVQLIHAAQAIDLPPGWSSATIEDLVGKEGVFVDGDWVESKDQDPTGDVRLIQLADIGDGEYRNRSDRFLTHQKALELGCTFLSKGDVLIARMPDPLGRACLFPGDRKKSVTVVDVAIVRSGKGEFNHRWLMYFINAPAFRTSMASLQSGSTRKRISRGNLARISLPVPPREQQQRIVAEIEKQFSRLDEAVANLKRVKANLKRYKAAVLKAAVEGKISSIDAVKWTRTNLGAVLTAIEAGKSFKCEERMPDKHEIGVVKVSAVTWGRYNEEESKTCLDPGRIETRYFVKPRDFLFSRANTIQLVGACVIAQRVTRKIMLSDKILRLQFSNHVVPQWVLYWLRSDIGRKEIQRLSTGNQESMRNIGQDRIRQIAVAIPSLDEQHQIVAEVERRLSVIEELEVAVEANLTRADRLRQSILSQAFAGNLVCVNANRKGRQRDDIKMARA